MSTELIVLVPGIATFARDEQREAFVDGLIKTAEKVIVEKVEDGTAPTAAVRLRLTRGAETAVADLYEAYWNDLVPSLAAAPSVKQKMVRGVSLFSYWFFSKIWLGGVWHRKYLTIGLTTSALALILWYLGVVGLFLEATLAERTAGPEAGWWVAAGHTLLDTISGWQLWAGATLFMALVPVPVLIDIIDFSKRFLTNEVSGERPIGLRVQVRSRLRQQLVDALGREQYSRLTVVAHSFGTVAAVDLLADLPLPAGMRFRLVTLGSPLEILAQKAPWLRDEVDGCAGRPELEAWHDLTIDSDWFATGIPLPDLPNCRAERIPAEGTFVDHLLARTHSRYFDHQMAVAAVVER